MTQTQNLVKLINEYVSNKAEIDRLTARNTELADIFNLHAEFKAGSQTGYLTGDTHKITVTRRLNTKWSQDKLEIARAEMQDDAFFKVFGWEYKPKSKKELDAFLEYGAPEQRQLIIDAMETTPGKPGIKIEEVK